MLNWTPALFNPAMLTPVKTNKSPSWNLNSDTALGRKHNYRMRHALLMKSDTLQFKPPNESSEV